VELLSAFRYGDEEVHYNLSFPLAVGNLKQLFRGSLEDKAGISIAVASLWSQFEGLANGLAYLHDECKIVHADLKSSNNLLYETSGSPPLVAKIADFGLAATLSNTATWTIGTVEAISAWKYDPPELRAHMAKAKLHSGDESRNEEIPSAEQLKRADIWKLGAVFIELSTFLVYGVSGIADFRHYITTKRKNITSDELSDTRFDDGVEVKTEVLDWIRRLSQCDPFVSEIEGILSQMLAKDVDRPSAAQVSSRLREVCHSLLLICTLSNKTVDKLVRLF
jgi:serine/threonine protein kinase